MEIWYETKFLCDLKVLLFKLLMGRKNINNFIKGKPGIMSIIPATWEVEAGGSWIQGKPWKLSKICIQNKNKTKCVMGVAQW